MIIYSGDQYAIPFTVKIGNELITPENCTDLRIQIGSDLRSWGSSTIDFNTENNTWDFYLTEDLTRSLLKGPLPYQIGVKMGDEIRYSSTRTLRIDDSIIKAVWSNA